MPGLDSNKKHFLLWKHLLFGSTMINYIISRVRYLYASISIYIKVSTKLLYMNPTTHRRTETLKKKTAHCVDRDIRYPQMVCPLELRVSHHPCPSQQFIHHGLPPTSSYNLVVGKIAISSTHQIWDMFPLRNRSFEVLSMIFSWLFACWLIRHHDHS